jgi:RNA methyltransferase, TrmH family
MQSSTVPIFGTYLEGTDIRTVDFRRGGMILIGNESRGIHPELEKFVTQKVTIPKSGQAESLNAALATGIILYELRR